LKDMTYAVDNDTAANYLIDTWSEYPIHHQLHFNYPFVCHFFITVEVPSIQEVI